MLAYLFVFAAAAVFSTSSNLALAAALSENAQCAATDATGTALQGTSINIDGFVVCWYPLAGTCEYFTPSGQFALGSGPCPASLTRGLDRQPNTNRALLANSALSSADDGIKVSKPMLITFLAVNCVLLLGGLVLGFLWWRERRRRTSDSSMKLGVSKKYINLDDASVKIPLALRPGRKSLAYDPPERPTSKFEE